MADNSKVRKPLALGQAKEVTLFKGIPNKAVLEILNRYIKAKTGRNPHQVDTFSGIILESQVGKIFFKDGQLEFEPNPFAVRQAKSWMPEIKQVLIAYAGKIFLESVKKVLGERYRILRDQEIKQGVLLEIADPEKDNMKFQVIVTPTGRVMVFSGSEEASGAVDNALDIVNFLESKGLVDF